MDFGQRLDSWRAQQAENRRKTLLDLEHELQRQEQNLIVNTVLSIIKALLTAGIPIPDLPPGLTLTWAELKAFRKWAFLRLTISEEEQLQKAFDVWIESIEVRRATGLSDEERVTQIMGGLSILVTSLLLGLAVPRAWGDLTWEPPTLTSTPTI